MPGAGLTNGTCAKALSDRPTFQPYWGKPAVRNDRGGGGNVGIIRSPLPRHHLTRPRGILTAPVSRSAGVSPAIFSVLHTMQNRRRDAGATPHRPPFFFITGSRVNLKS